MASKSLFCILFLVVLLSIQAQGDNNFNLAMASKALSDKGYHAMLIIFDVFFKTHDVSQWLTGNPTLTVFAPPEHAFFSSKYPQPLILLQYHVVLLKLDIEALASIPYGPKIDTLLLGHPLVFTTLPADESASLNRVKFTEWNLYDDRGLIIHGIGNFFDPASQTLIYPLFNAKNEVHAEANSEFSWVTKELTENQSPILAMVVIGLGLQVLSFSYCKDKQDEYVHIQQQEEEEVKEVVESCSRR